MNAKEAIAEIERFLEQINYSLENASEVCRGFQPPAGVSDDEQAAWEATERYADEHAGEWADCLGEPLPETDVLEAAANRDLGLADFVKSIAVDSMRLAAEMHRKQP